MNHDRDALITAFRAHYGASATEAEQAMRAVELAYAEKQNAEHLRQMENLRHSNSVLQRMLETMPDKHMRFPVLNGDGTIEEPTECADWCNACKLDGLRDDVNDWKSREAAARSTCVRLATVLGHCGEVMAHLHAGRYDEAIDILDDRL